MDIMGIFNRILRKTNRGYANPIDDEGREQSLEIRRVKAEIRKKQELLKLREVEAQLADLDYELSEDEEQEGDNPDNLLMSMFSKILAQPTTAPIQSPGIEPTDEEIKAMLNSLPNKYLKQAKKMDDTAIIGIIKSYMPYSTDRVSKRILNIMRSEY